MLAGLIVACDSSVNDKLFGSTDPNYIDFSALTNLGYSTFSQDIYYFKADNAHILTTYTTLYTDPECTNPSERSFCITYFNNSYSICDYQEGPIGNIDESLVENIFNVSDDNILTISPNSNIQFMFYTLEIPMHIGNKGATFKLYT